MTYTYRVILYTFLVSSAAFAYPTAEVRADWPVARATLVQFMETIASAINAIKVASTSDNAEVGQIISSK